MNSKHINLIYLFTILSSSLFYAFATTQLISQTTLSPFTIILISTSLELIIYFDLNYVKGATRLSTRSLSIIGVILLIAAQILLMPLVNHSLVLIVLYLICTYLFNVYLLNVENHIVDSSTDTRTGLISITTLRTLSKLIGFGLGPLFQYLSLWYFSLFLIFTFIILASLNIKNQHSLVKAKLSIKSLNEKYIIFVLLSLASVSVFIIPKLVQTLHDKDLLAYSSLPFVLPVVCALIYLKYLKHTRFNNNLLLKCVTSLILIIAFLTLDFLNMFFFINIFIISIIITLNIAITIDIRAYFISRNKHINLKNLLQFLNLISAISLLVFSILGLWFIHIPVITLLLNAMTLIILIIIIPFKRALNQSSES
ncbi:MFS family permease [Staphylococcus auricularis]|uniref:Uncharacterized protein n=1 Tax=Staphylococcus auricularis TaxID=29379 RepID=A0AAP8TSR3_9STAP|nr:hypothetical protein [Staphylococcus auricularis]PNZ66622.1 hypothetical protein CD158_08060 [Staphylococcus auricularis]SQJ06306.1 Uncharacterised protein [Staphylococcus auricularis]